MTMDEPLLRAYVDGELDPALRDQVEAAVAHSPELQDLVRQLRASCLPYRAAFEAQQLPEPPASLMQMVESLTAVAAPLAAPANSSSPGRASHNRRQWLGWGAALAAAFSAGLVVPWRPGASTAPADAAPWVRAIAIYHALYVRETVSGPGDRPERLHQLTAGFSAEQRARLAVPDLSDEGLVFKRVQRLGYGPAPLIQMVFLPTEGRPAALCVLPVTQADAPAALQVIEGLNVVSWNDRGLAHVLVAELPGDRLLALARRLGASATGTA